MRRIASLCAIAILFIAQFSPTLAFAQLLGDTTQVGKTWFDSPTPYSSQQLFASTGNLESYALRSYNLSFQQENETATPNAHTWNDYLATFPGYPYASYFYLDREEGITRGGVCCTTPADTLPFYLLEHKPELSIDGFRPYLYTWNPYSTWLPGIDGYEWTPYPELGLGMQDLGNPHMAIGNDGRIHTLVSTYSDSPSGTISYYYYAWELDTETWQFSSGMLEDGPPLLITDSSRNLSSDIACSEDGSHIAIALLIPRDEETDGRETIRTMNNDLVLYESFDGGLNWDLDSPTDVTQWLPIDHSLLPDTVTANQDTLRCIRDSELIIDSEGVIHVFFTVAPMHYYNSSTRPESRIYHWDSETHFYTLVAEGVDNFDGYVLEDGTTVSNPAATVKYDRNYCLVGVAFRRASNQDNDPERRDCANGIACSDIWLTMSPNWLNWTRPINITETLWNDIFPMQPGNARSETDISLSMSGNILQLNYLVDTWPGAGAESTPSKGITVHHTIDYREALSKIQDEVGSLDPYGEGWLRNYPLHVDSTGFYQGVYEEINTVNGEPAHPVGFTLDQNVPNPFNPSTRISFELHQPASVKLVVYDVLGREMAVLLNRSMNSGHHSVRYRPELPSGIYFYRLTVGKTSLVRKMVLMK